MRFVTTCRRMLLVHLRKLTWLEAFRQPHQRRPQAPMNQRHLSINEAANKNIGRFGELLEHRKDLMTFRMRPPAALDRLTGNHLRHARHRSARCRKHDAVLLNKSHCLFKGHALLHSGAKNARDEAFYRSKVCKQLGRQRVSPDDVCRRVEDDLHPTWRWLDNKGLQRKIHTGLRIGKHERRTGPRIAEEYQRGRRHRQPDCQRFGTLIDRGEYLDAAIRKGSE